MSILNDELSIEATKTERSTIEKGNYLRTGIFKFYPEKENVNYHVKFLTDVHNGLPIRIHIFKGQPPQICRVHPIYSEDSCSFCNMPSAFDPEGKKKNRPLNMYALMCYVFESYNNVVTGKDGKEYDDNPVKVAEFKRDLFIPGTNGGTLIQDGNIKRFLDYSEVNSLTEDLWIVSRKGKVVSWEVASPARMRDIVKNVLPDANVPTEVLNQYMNMDRKSIRGLLLNAYNCDWNNTTLLSKVTKPTERANATELTTDSLDNI